MLTPFLRIAKGLEHFVLGKVIRCPVSLLDRAAVPLADKLVGLVPRPILRHEPVGQGLTVVPMDPDNSVLAPFRAFDNND